VAHCLGGFYDKVFIPEAVKKECCNGYARRAIQYDFIEVVSVKNILALGMGAGEREAISLAVELGITKIITDDKKAFNNAVRQKLKPIRIFNFLVIAKYAGLIPLVKPILDQMIDKGEGISEDVYFQTLQDAGE
jgi:predicted nucleic acid-binding protein